MCGAFFYAVSASVAMVRFNNGWFVSVDSEDDFYGARSCGIALGAFLAFRRVDVGFWHVAYTLSGCFT